MEDSIKPQEYLSFNFLTDFDMRTKRQIIISIILGGLLFQGSEGTLQAQQVKSGTASLRLNYVPDKSVDNRPPVLEILNPPLEVGVPFFTKEEQLDLFCESIR